MDWGLGRYEQIALQLLPASEAALVGSNLRAGERVLDIGCGSGNASLLAAERGGSVTAVDPAQRLLALGMEREAEEDQPMGAAGGMVLAGSRLGDLRAVCDTRSRGFESALRTVSAGPHYAVRALDAGGEALGRSRTITLTS